LQFYNSKQKVGESNAARRLPHAVAVGFKQAIATPSALPLVVGDCTLACIPVCVLGCGVSEMESVSSAGALVAAGITSTVKMIVHAA